MKIAVTSDLHGMLMRSQDRETIQDADVLLVCGDVFEGRDMYGRENIRLLVWLESLVSNGRRVVLTPGNHDWFLGMPNNTWVGGGIDVLVDNEVVINGVRIYGTPWTPTFGCWNYMADDSNLLPKFRMMPEHVDILISHTPPLIEEAKIDMSLQTRRKEHLGSASLAKAIAERRPRYCFCGHIHTGDCSLFKFHDTLCRNVSYVNESYIPFRPPFVFNI